MEKIKMVTLEFLNCSSGFITWSYIICWSMKYTLGQWENEGHGSVAVSLPVSELKWKKSLMRCWWHMYRCSLGFWAEWTQHMLLHTCFLLALCSPVADLHCYLALVEYFQSVKTFNDCIQFCGTCRCSYRWGSARITAKLWERGCVSQLWVGLTAG